MIDLKDNTLKERLQEIIASKVPLFEGISKLKDYTVKLQHNDSVKPVSEPPRRILYHLKSRIEEVVTDMRNQDVIEELPVGQQTPWILNMVSN